VGVVVSIIAEMIELVHLQTSQEFYTEGHQNIAALKNGVRFDLTGFRLPFTTKENEAQQVLKV
jgi:hypothetical protein